MSLTAKEVLPAAQHQDTTVSSFFSLPRELRDIIYCLLIGEKRTYHRPPQQEMDSNDYYISWRLSSIYNRFAIARTCHTANYEANEVIYKTNKFSFYPMSKEWLSPQISQKIANLMQNIYITFGYDETSRTESIQLLQMFASSQGMRQKCRIRFLLDYLDDIIVMPLVFRTIASLTTFQIVIVEMTSVDGSINLWSTPMFDQARASWISMIEDLESELGKVTNAGWPDPRSFKFKPREYLMQKAVASLMPQRACIN